MSKNLFIPKSAKHAFAFLAYVLVLNVGLWQLSFAKSPNKVKAQNLSESYELSEADKSFIELRDAARKNDVVREWTASSRIG